MDRETLLPLSAAALGLAGLATIPGVLSILDQIRSRKPKDNFYEDVDGASTPEAMAAFSNKRPKIAILCLSAIGLATSIAVSVLSVLQSARDGLMLENWLTTATWAAIVVQAVNLGAHHSPVQSHWLGIWAAGSSLVAEAVIVLQAMHVGQLVELRNDPGLILRIVNVATAIGLAIACLLLPRRPDVYYKGGKVDGERTVSFLNRYTWTWAESLIRLARKKGDLEEKDIPKPDHTLRSGLLVAAWRTYSFKGGMIASLVRAYRNRILIQWGVAIPRCFVGVLPFTVLLRLLKILETRAPNEEPTPEIWYLILSLGLLAFTEQWLDGWVLWYSIAMLSMPMRGQLSALVFEKSLKRKNVKSAEKQKEDSPESEDSSKKEDTKDADKDKDDDDSVLKSQQSVVNLIGVDSNRIAQFAIWQVFAITSIGKLILYSIFLLNLIGPIPFGVGVIAWAIVVPINAWVSKKFLKCEDQLMKVRDKKLAVVNEALLGIRQIKFSALENAWEERIMEMRDKEMGVLRTIFGLDIIMVSCWVASPILLAAASLATYAAIHGDVTPSVAFVSIGIFKSLELSLSVLPELLNDLLSTLISARRIDTYLNGPEMKNIRSIGTDVAFEKASIAWPIDASVPDEERFILNNVNLSFPAGELSVISGKTGTGKSLLLSALLGEADLLEGSIYLPTTVTPSERNDGKAHLGNWILAGSVAYVAQTPWLETTSFRDNILFGLPFIESRYETVLRICALKKDLEILPDGDKTELGANGINLSGGQKWRVTLARAVYSRAEILVLDDIFSAVDAHVGRQIFESCIGGDICKGRTRILVTHHVTLVQKQTKYLVELGDGTVLHAGLTSDLIEDGTLAKIKSHEQSVAEARADETAVNSDLSEAEAEAPEGDEDQAPLKRVQSKDAKKFVDDERREKGGVKKHVYLTYLKHSGGWLFWIFCVFLYAVFESANVSRAWWVRIWTGQSEERIESNIHEEHGMAYTYAMQGRPLHGLSETFVTTSTTSTRHSVSFYLWIYVALSVFSGVMGAVRFAWSFKMSLRASKVLFRNILFSVIRAPLRWVDTVPVGRILNRLTADFDVIDSQITFHLGTMIWRILGLLGVCVAATLVSVYILPVAGLLVVVATIIGKTYLAAARPVKRLESNSKSPVFELFNAALSGVSTIRGYQKTPTYIDRMHALLDAWGTKSVYMWVLNRWMSVRMALVGTAFVTITGVIVILAADVDAALAGFTLSFALEFSGNMLMAIRTYSSLELSMNAAERVIEFAELETESQGGENPPAAWPTSGKIEVKDLEVGYAPDLPAVLKGLSFNVANNERIGVVGRTGAGKSSLTLALFRFLEARSGSVIIDGVDISKVNLQQLRSRLAIIPQDPVLFSGTIRSNLDPFDDHTDDVLRDCLGRVHLVDSATGTPNNEAEPSSAAASIAATKNVNIFKDLKSGISESGGNLSQGQRQLLCIARAIVSRPKLMVLDEATSAVDMATDALIQRSIREEFTDSTLIVIAHRLSTIADFDRILVLSDGTAAEFGTPKELWNKEGGMFRDMCEQSGEKDSLRQTILGE